MRISLFSWLFFVPICSVFLNFGIFVVSQTCTNVQRDFLIGMKNNLKFNKTSSKTLVYWNKSSNCCSWEGVTCSKEGRVIGLDLFNESITGGLHNSSLYSLQNLQTLNLAYNDLSSSAIPSQFGRLTKLSYLNLSNAGIIEQIPIEISRLTRLVTLDLSINKLDLKNPNLAMLVQNLTRLTELYLDRIPISLQGNEWCQALSSSLPNLKVLSMSYCNLQGPLDSSLLKLQSLSIINLNLNNFNAPVPEFFADFKNLTSLNLCYCGLNGQFPKKIFQVPTLQMVDISDNELLEGSLPEFYPNGSLQSLLLRGTKFSGTLPDSIGSLKRLSEIDFSKCNFTGSIPNSVTNLTQLVYLYMSSNKFTGPIPSFSMAKNLTMIDLSYNNLIGQITFSHGKELQSLVELYLHHNSLEGSIPASLFLLPSLRKLHLRNNHFSGQLLEFLNVSSFLLE